MLLFLTVKIYYGNRMHLVFQTFPCFAPDPNLKTPGLQHYLKPLILFLDLNITF